MAVDKSNVLLYGDWLEQLEAMSDESAAELIKAIAAFVLRREEHEIKSEAARISFIYMKRRILIDTEKYIGVTEKRRKAAEKRWETKQTDANGMQMDANGMQMDTEQVQDQEQEQVQDRVIKKSRAFRPPSLQDVRDYCIERKNNVDPEQWYAFYESKGWMIGKNKMNDWKAAVRTWEKRDTDKPKKQTGQFYQFQQGEYDYAEIERRLREN